MITACGALFFNLAGAAATDPEFMLTAWQSLGAWLTPTKPLGGPNLKGFSPKFKSISAF